MGGILIRTGGSMWGWQHYEPHRPRRSLPRFQLQRRQLLGQSNSRLYGRTTSRHHSTFGRGCRLTTPWLIAATSVACSYRRLREAPDDCIPPPMGSLMCERHRLDRGANALADAHAQHDAPTETPDRAAAVCPGPRAEADEVERRVPHPATIR
jgi:hypothetical protein